MYSQCINSYVYFYLGLDLTFDSIISFLKEKGFSEADAETLGVHLKVPWPEIRTMKNNNVGNARGLYYDIIYAWLQLTEPSLELLAVALDKSDYKKIARKIRGEIEMIMDWCSTCASYLPLPFSLSPSLLSSCGVAFEDFNMHKVYIRGLNNYNLSYNIMFMSRLLIVVLQYCMHGSGNTIISSIYGCSLYSYHKTTPLPSLTIL